MLKIKDDVDLKELEKFGFILKIDTYEMDNCFSDYYIDKESRKIIIADELWEEDDLDIIYELTNAGLVEKV